MSTIVFKGKKYDSLADMPAKIRHEYFKAKAGYDILEEEPEDTGMLPKGIENMPSEVREIYERVRNDLDANPINATPVDELPKTEDLYRRSAPDRLRDMPSDEFLYKPSAPIIEPPPPIIESDHTMRRLAIAVAVGLLLFGIAAAIYFGV